MRRHGAALGIAFALKKRRRAAALQGALRAQRVETWALLSAGWRLSEQYWGWLRGELLHSPSLVVSNILKLVLQSLRRRDTQRGSRREKFS